MKRVIVHIDRLVLKGFKRKDRDSIATELQLNLTQLLSDPQAVHQLAARRDSSQLQCGNINIDLNSKPHGVGVKFAQGIGRKLLE